MDKETQEFGELPVPPQVKPSGDYNGYTAQGLGVEDKYVSKEQIKQLMIKAGLDPTLIFE